jgi:hypothetical protein
MAFLTYSSQSAPAAPNYCMQRTAGRLGEVISKAALAGRR